MDRKISKILKSKPTIEGAGVHLKRGFGYNDIPLLDPFLMLDDFHSSDPDEYIAGFPWHPHRGIETVSYILHGEIAHGDSMGNKGSIGPGDVQWMTAGSGIIHSEMPREVGDGLLWGFQLWVNLPASHKMMNPRYQEIKKAQIPEVSLENGVKIKIVAGELNGVKGPVGDIVIEPEFLDVSIPANTEFTHFIKEGHKVFAYVLSGNAYFDKDMDKLTDNEHVVIYNDGENISVTTKENAVRFLLISGQSINEPIAWHGPIVMNTKEELSIAFEEYNNGTFIKSKK